jgi:hypothetical protein
VKATYIHYWLDGVRYEDRGDDITDHVNEILRLERKGVAKIISRIYK